MLGRTVVVGTLDKYYAELNARLSASTSMIFVDTNILAYFYRLFPGARKELRDWFSSLKDAQRLRVPAWVANEYFAKLSSNNLREYLPEFDSAAPIQQLEAQVRLARLVLDNPVRDGVIQKLSDAIDALRPVLSKLRVNKKDKGLNDIHAEVEDTFLECVLASDTARLCVEAATVAPHRFLHRVPPGFEDADKKKNPFGDLILWLELLESSMADPRPYTILITNDEKKDWSYAPRFRQRLTDSGSHGPEENKSPEIRITDPRLVREFQNRVGIATAFEVVSIAHVIAALSCGEPSKFRLLSGALQVTLDVSAQDLAKEDMDAVALPPPAEQVEHPELEPVQDQATQTVVAALVFGATALADSTYRTDQARPLDPVIAELRSHNWHTQNPAMLRLASLARAECLQDSWFVLGRNIYQAACGNAFEAGDYVRHLETNLQHLLPDAAEAVLAGMIFEVYFDGEGCPRTTFKIRFLSELNETISLETHSRARQFVRGRLAHGEVAVALLPGEIRDFVVKLLANGRPGHLLIEDLRVNGESAIRAGGGSERVLGIEEHLRELIACRYGIPMSYVALDIAPTSARGGLLWWSEGTTLRPADEMFVVDGDTVRVVPAG